MATQAYRYSRSILSFLALGIIPACSPGNQQTPTNPPLFGGLVSATPLAGSPGDIVLVWAPAVDFAGGGVVYNIWYTIGSLPAQSGMETLQLSTANSTGVTVTGLTPLDPYIFFVQAQDAQGNTDGNTIEVAATAP